MTNTVAIIGPAADASVGQSPFSQAQQVLSPEALAQDQGVVSNPADLRLVIEEDKAAGTFVYKTVDWRTGEVIQQLPREQVLRLREAQNYSAGQLLTTKA